MSIYITRSGAATGPNLALLEAILSGLIAVRDGFIREGTCGRFYCSYARPRVREPLSPRNVNSS